MTKIIEVKLATIEQARWIDWAKLEAVTYEVPAGAIAEEVARAVGRAHNAKANHIADEVWRIRYGAPGEDTPHFITWKY